jgi:hypothetical protein
LESRAAAELEVPNASSAQGSGRSAAFTGNARQIPAIVPASSDKIASTAAKATAQIRTKSMFEESIVEWLPVVCSRRGGQCSATAMGI